MKLSELPRDIVYTLAAYVPWAVPLLVRASKDLWALYKDDLHAHRPALAEAQRARPELLHPFADALLTKWPAADTTVARPLAPAATLYQTHGDFFAYTVDRDSGTSSLRVLSDCQELFVLVMPCVQALALNGETLVAATRLNMGCVALGTGELTHLFSADVEGTLWHLSLTDEGRLFALAADEEEVRAQALFCWRTLEQDAFSISPDFQDTAVRMAASDAWLAMGFQGCLVQCSDLRDAARRFGFKAHDKASVKALCFGADENTLVSSNGMEVRIWDLAQRACVCSAQGWHRSAHVSESGFITLTHWSAVILAPDGEPERRLAVDMVYRAQSGRRRVYFKIGDGTMMSVKF